MTDNSLTLANDAIGNTLALIERMAVNKDVDADKMGKLLDLQIRVMDRQAEMDFNRAFGELMPLIPRIKKDGSVSYPVDKNKPDGPKKEAFKFATYEQIDSVIRPLLQEKGFSLTFSSEPKEGGGLLVHATLSHIGGHHRTATIPVALDTSGGKNNIQGIGSSFSYGKRYGTYMLLNLVAEGDDDDGQKGGMVFIDDKSVKAINDLIEETKSNRDAFMQMMGVVDIANILASDYAKAVNALMAKKRKAGAA